MSYTVNTKKGSYRFTHAELVEIAEQRILGRDEMSNIDKLFEIVCQYYKVPKHQVLGISRKKELVEARRVLSYMLTEQMGYSFRAAGRIIELDRATVMYHSRYIKEGIDLYQDTRDAIDHIMKQYKNTNT
jgi:chromosomal replication initiation ATPase DnaA